MLCRWCEQPVEKMQILVDKKFADQLADGLYIYVWVHPTSRYDPDKAKVACDGNYPAWHRNFADAGFGGDGPSVATPNFNYEPHPRIIRAAERGLRNLLRQLG